MDADTDPSGMKGTSAELPGSSPNTVHLIALFVVSCFGCKAPQGYSDHRLHQPGSDCQDLSVDPSSVCAGEDGESQYSPARPARARGGLLRDRLGVLYALVLSRGVALLAGRNPVAAQPVREAQSGWQVGNLAGALAARMGAGATLAR